MLQSVLILDPPDHCVEDLRSIFQQQVSPGCEVCLFTRADDLFDALSESKGPLVAIIHGERGDGHVRGLDLIPRIQQISPEAPIVVVADHGDVESAAAAIEAGANDFLVRGPKLSARVATLLGKLRQLVDALGRARSLDAHNAELQEAIQAQFRIVGESPQIRQLISDINAVARVPRPVLIVGERGTGKELVGRAIHFAAGKSDQPIVCVNCAAFSDALLESELFGHEKGAFTGADSVRDGKFAQADGGTLFLDEIGHMSLPFQRKILRVVEYGTYSRVGGQSELKSTARVIAATNVNLKEKIRGGEFLNDLYDRLAFDVIQVAPLRDREGDIDVLAQHFLDQFALEIPDFSGKRLSKATLRMLRRFPFPGNVRELKNIIERAAYRDTTNEITPEDIGILSDEHFDMREGTFHQRIDAYRRHLITDALKQANGNQAEAARRLGLSYHQFRYYHQKLAAENGD
ncbi:MAG TPA: sigma-54 dependent transcriptional regulator [Pirellulales bacterium]|nr:sigma-54 dependent transcriptional regulator [Pirellulales bacterium]